MVTHKLALFLRNGDFWMVGYEVTRLIVDNMWLWLEYACDTMSHNQMHIQGTYIYIYKDTWHLLNAKIKVAFFGKAASERVSLQMFRDSEYIWRRVYDRWVNADACLGLQRFHGQTRGSSICIYLRYFLGWSYPLK